MKLSKTRQAIVEEFEDRFGTDIYKHTSGYWNGDISEPAHDEHISAEITNYLTNALNDYTESIVRMVEGKYKNATEGTKHVRIDDDYPPIACDYNDALNDIKEELGK